MSKEKVEIILPSRIESVEEAAQSVSKVATRFGIGEDSIFGIDLAVREAVANAVKHGNKLDETKPVEITFSKTNEGFEIEIRDFGKGFEPDEVPDPTQPENLLKASGRGILFMRNFMDEVTWENHEDGGTIVKMTKKL